MRCGKESKWELCRECKEVKHRAGALIEYYKGGVREDGAPIEPNDAQEIMDLLKELWATGDTRKVAEGVLGATDIIWKESKEDLNKIPGLTDLVELYLNSIEAIGMLNTVKAMLAYDKVEDFVAKIKSTF